MDPTVDRTANMSNMVALIYERFDYHWVGFYRIIDNYLMLGPFQGPIACTKIEFNKGVCGAAWATEKVQIVDDVNQFSGHIACSPLTKSEIVIPCFSQDNIWGVFDVDSSNYKSFDKTDQVFFEQILSLL